MGCEFMIPRVNSRLARSAITLSFLGTVRKAQSIAVFVTNYQAIGSEYIQIGRFRSLGACMYSSDFLPSL